MKNIVLFLFAAFLFVGSGGVMAQIPDYVRPKEGELPDSVAFYEFKTIEGNKFYGRIIKETPTELTIKMNSGSMILQRGSIVAKNKVQNDSYQKKGTPMDTVSFFEVRTVDGRTVLGRIISETPAEMVLKSTYGQVTIQKGLIAAINKIKVEGGGYTGVDEAKVFIRNRSNHQALIGQTAQNMRRGDMSIGQQLYAFTIFTAGFTDNFQMGFGTMLFRIDRPIIYLAPKYSVALSEKLRIAAGGHFLSVPTDYTSASYGRKYGGYYYSVLTYGTNDRNISAGGGYGYLDGELSRNAVLTMSGNVRVSQGVSLLGELYVTNSTDQNNFYSFGVRYSKTQRSRWDFAWLTATYDETIPNYNYNPPTTQKQRGSYGFLMINYAYNFK